MIRPRNLYPPPTRGAVLFLRTGFVPGRVQAFWLRLFAIFWLGALVTSSVRAQPANQPARPGAIEFFENKIRPVLVDHCYACHSSKKGKNKGRLQLDTADALRRGGESGPAIIAGKPEESLLIRAIRYSEKDLRMPPPGDGRSQLNEMVVRDFEAWIRDGAIDPRTEDSFSKTGASSGSVSSSLIPTEEQKAWWAYQPLRPTKAWIQTMEKTSLADERVIDFFIESSWKEKGLQGVARADKRTLIRRVTFDLTGLPSTANEVEQFLQDESPLAFAKVVDRLLQSSQYGEAWARHWLDTVRYTDYISPGGTADGNAELVEAYRYRDWVVSSLNKDLPYDQFIIHQISGDKIPHPQGEPVYKEGIVATGFLAIGAWDNGDADKDKVVSDIVDDQIDVMGRVFLGTTLACARCHDHKFDPVTQEDYYALAGIFYSSRALEHVGAKGAHTVQLRIPLVSPTQVYAREKSLERLAQITEQLAALASSTNETEKAALAKERDQIKASPQIPRALGVLDGGTPGGIFPSIQDVPLHVRGSYTRLANVVPRGLPKFLSGNQTVPIKSGSGRFELAHWIASTNNPLTARVLVNRVWQHHFGQGLVRTSNNFGKLGEKPSHPELLDWLAARFMEDGWSVKKLHRMILLSDAYQRASTVTPQIVEKDPENLCLARQNARRLPAEAIRDAILTLSGKLDLTQRGGRATEDMNSGRRSIYISTVRNDRRNFSTLFDAANPEQIVESRTISTSPGQALFFLNNSFVLEQARQIAAQLQSQGSDDEARLLAAWKLFYHRLPLDGEKCLAMDFLTKAESREGGAGWTDLVHSLLLSNEFIYLD